MSGFYRVVLVALMLIVTQTSMYVFLTYKNIKIVLVCGTFNIMMITNTLDPQ